MARKKIREYHAKKMVNASYKRLTQVDLGVKVAIVTAETNFETIVKESPWLLSEKLVVKPDLLFGKRGKNNLVLLNANWDAAVDFCRQRLGTSVTVGKVTGALSHFLVEPFVPHKKEYYLAIVSEREGNAVNFSALGGIDVEENWEGHVKVVHIPIEGTLDQSHMETLLVEVEDSDKAKTAEFLINMYRVFEDLDFTSMEINPFTFNDEGQARALDFVGEIDDSALYRNARKWGQIEFPHPFGARVFPEEEYVRSLDEKTGASLKLTILNPTGRIWNLVAGGGASVIFADTVADLGFGAELGNYGEYSGAPNDEETYHYAKTLLDLATRNPDGRGRALLIAGGVANFTDVAKTFKGIIHALNEYKDKIREANMRIYVRRAGPNYVKGLKSMQDFGEKSRLHVEVFGPEVPMTRIVPMACTWVRENGTARA